MRTALTIAGSDSGAGAGIQADLKTFAAHGVYGTSVITAVTAQNTVGVTMFEALSPALVRAQLDAVMSDIGSHAAKTGMLATAAIVETVAAAVADLRIARLVVDPVMVAKSGDRLIDDEAIGALRAELLPRAYLVTPNIPEAEALSGLTIAEYARLSIPVVLSIPHGPTAADQAATWTTGRGSSSRCARHPACSRCARRARTTSRTSTSTSPSGSCAC